MTSWVLYFTYYRRKRSTAEQIMEQVAIGWKTQYEAEAVPANIKAAESEIAVKEESFKGKGEAGQTWKVFHCSSPKGHSTEKVVIYWHGGAFIISVRFFFALQSLKDADRGRAKLSIGQQLIDLSVIMI